MDSLLQASKRTIAKVLKRLDLGCFECGWKVCPCDLHHILPQSRGGDDSHTNLTYLCPNCHRMAHAGILTQFKTMQDVVGDSWKDHYNVTPRANKPRQWVGKRKQNQTASWKAARNARSEEASERATKKIQELELAGIDRTRYGWIQEASKILGVAPQRVRWYLNKYRPSYLEGCKVRK